MSTHTARTARRRRAAAPRRRTDPESPACTPAHPQGLASLEVADHGEELDLPQEDLIHPQRSRRGVRGRAAAQRRRTRSRGRAGPVATAEEWAEAKQTFS